MDVPATPKDAILAAKIARLVEERGWNQEDFARIANLNRHTVRDILKNTDSRTLRNATVKACAEALGLEVSELRNLPLEALLPRMHPQRKMTPPPSRLEAARIPEMQAWIERYPDRADQLVADDWHEIITLAASGLLGRIGADHLIELIERRRRLLERVSLLAASEHLSFLEQFVCLLFEKYRPTRER